MSQDQPLVCCWRKCLWVVLFWLYRLVYILCHVCPLSSCWVIEAVPGQVLVRTPAHSSERVTTPMAGVTFGSHWASDKSCSQDLHQDILLPGSLGQDSLTLRSRTLPSNRVFSSMFRLCWGDGCDFCHRDNAYCHMGYGQEQYLRCSIVLCLLKTHLPYKCQKRIFQQPANVYPTLED